MKEKILNFGFGSFSNNETISSVISYDDLFGNDWNIFDMLQFRFIW
jgi:hypothetical protein